MRNKKFFLNVISIALITGGILAILAVTKGGASGLAACTINETSKCSTSTITGGVIGALQSGGVITGVIALFVVGLGAVILINSMRSRSR